MLHSPLTFRQGLSYLLFLPVTFIPRSPTLFVRGFIISFSNFAAFKADSYLGRVFHFLSSKSPSLSSFNPFIKPTSSRKLSYIRLLENSLFKPPYFEFFSHVLYSFQIPQDRDQVFCICSGPHVLTTVHTQLITFHWSAVSSLLSKSGFLHFYRTLTFCPLFSSSPNPISIIFSTTYVFLSLKVFFFFKFTPDYFSPMCRIKMPFPT